MIGPRQAKLGEKYVMQVTGIVGQVVAECTKEPNIAGDGRMLEAPHFKVLNKGMLHDAILKSGDYILEEVYVEAQNGPIL